MSKIIKTTIILTVFSLAIRFFGLIREMVFAAFYGASSAMDAFVVASSVPSMFVGVAVTAIITAFIPIYTEYKNNSHYDDAANFVQTIICIVMVITSIVVLICFIFASQIIFALAPGFNIETQRLSSDLLRIMIPILFFSGLLGIGSSLQQANNQFYYYAVSQLILNVVTIIVIFFYAPRYGIFAAGVASVLSIIVQVLIILVGMPSCGYNKFKWNLNFRHPGIRKMVRFVIPVMISLVIVNINSIVTRIIASSLPSGSIAALNYAIRVNLVFVSLLVYPVTTTIYPLLSQQFEKNNISDFKRYINTSIRLIVFLIIPISTMAAIFPNQIISILFERGVFDKNSAAQTATIFMFYVLG
ncbi:murein biosynthesis integral membrane protein MurJ, partial [bacterium]|nr:murein biosynthesis integral membrane protein MurJ [bacterium]